MKGSRLLMFFLAAVLMLTLSSCAANDDGGSAEDPANDDGGSAADPIYVEHVNSDFVVYYFDVGQGDSSLIVADGEAMLIDAGASGAADYIISYVSELGIDELSYVVATHPHSDHIGGLPAVLDAFSVNTFLAPDAVHTTKAFENMMDAIERNNLEITIAEPLDTYTLGSAVITVLSPERKEYENLNNYSVVLRITYGETSFLFMGDAEKEIEDEMLDKGFDLSAEGLKVGHHGSETSSSPAFLDAVSPQIAVISYAEDNAYGHPHKVTTSNILRRGAMVFETPLDGTVTVISDGENIEVVR